MSNRRKIKGGRTTQRPSGRDGVWVDSEPGKVFATFDCGRASFTIEWSPGDAKAISELIAQASLDAATGKKDEEKIQVARESGLIVASTIDAP